MTGVRPNPAGGRIAELIEQRDAAMKRLAAVHKSNACGVTYNEPTGRWCDCGYLTLLEKYPELEERR